MIPLVAATATLALVYAGACWLRPFARCSMCKGAGCWWCGRRGAKLRLGRWVWNRATELRRQAAVAERAQERR